MIRLIIATVIAAATAGTAIAADYRVLIATWRGCEEACQGFQDYLTEKGLDVEFLVLDAGQDREAVPGILADARESDVDLIVSWGTSVTRGIAGTLTDADDPAFNHDIPQVFMIVADPVGSGVIADLDSTGRPNVTGTFNRMPEDVTVQTIRAYDPAFQHLGMLYNTDEPNSVLKRDEMNALAEARGFTLTALELPLGPDGAPTIDSIPAKVAELKQAGVDFIYLGSSSFLRENGEVLAAAAMDSELPVLSPYEQLVREGDALLSVAARYYDVGQLAGIQAERILVDGNAPGDLPVLRMTDFAVVINLNVAQDLKRLPPMGLLQIAETVK